jgi:hypothetical protein
MKLSMVRRLLGITTLLLTIGSLLIIAGTFYTADHFRVQSITTQKTTTPQGFTLSVTFDTQNDGLYPITLNLFGRILSGQHEVVRNSTLWTVDPGTGGNHTFVMQIDNATAATYFTPASQPILDFSVNAQTAYGLISVTLAGQRSINSTGG